MRIEGICIFVVPDAIAVGIHRLIRVIWEFVDVVVNSIAIPVIVGIITNTIFVSVA